MLLSFKVCSFLPTPISPVRVLQPLVPCVYLSHIKIFSVNSSPYQVAVLSLESFNLRFRHRTIKKRAFIFFLARTQKHSKTFPVPFWEFQKSLVGTVSIHLYNPMLRNLIVDVELTFQTYDSIQVQDLIPVWLITIFIRAEAS